MGCPKMDGTDRFDPTNEIIKKFIEIKSFSDKNQKLWDLRKALNKHLEQVKHEISANTDGVILPNRMGRLILMGYKCSNNPVDWGKTNQLRARGINKVVFFNNFHSDGYVYKVFYKTYYNATRGIRHAYYANKDMWKFSSAQLFGKSLKDKIKEGNYFHKIEKLQLSPKLNKKISIEEEW